MPLPLLTSVAPSPPRCACRRAPPRAPPSLPSLAAPPPPSASSSPGRSPPAPIPVFPCSPRSPPPGPAAAASLIYLLATRGSSHARSEPARAAPRHSLPA
ncbi:hypothetical protein ZWY2020_054047 [Hordeum vulgare]|nr:hypothetical protein ZWY2020_054047 [Hordeum vulgare]